MAMTELHILVIAAVLGLLVGLQRQWADSIIAGARTFPLITVLGALCAFLAESYSKWVLPAGLVSLASFVVLGNVAKFKKGQIDPGMTTEVATLVMFGVGAVLMAGYTAMGVAAGGMVAVLLQWKTPLHKLIGKATEADLRAVARLVLIGLVILPLLPDRAFGPYEVLNPFRIWLMVVLIVGISLGAYVGYKLLGERVGTVLAGVLGGLISSTAATVSYARQSRANPSRSAVAAVVIMIASTVVFARVLIEIAIVAPAVLKTAAAPIAVMGGYMAVICVGALLSIRGSQGGEVEQDPPSNLAAAIVFGLMYAVVLLAVAVAKDRFGDVGLYAVAAMSGLADMDAITLSTAEMINLGRVDAATGWRLIMVGALANIVFKGMVVGVLGAPRLFGRVAVLFGLTLLGGAMVIAFWPG